MKLDQNPIFVTVSEYNVKKTEDEINEIHQLGNIFLINYQLLKFNIIKEHQQQ